MNTNIITMRNPLDTNDAAASHLHQIALILLRQKKLLMEIQRQRFLKEESRTDLMLFEPEMAIRGAAQSPGCSFGEQKRSEAPATVAVVPSFKEDQVLLQADKREERIVLEKPDPNVFRQKRKAETPLISTNDIKPFGTKKEWSCGLCRVTVTNERTFNQHLHGKKHKCKEEGLRTQKASNVSPEPLPNKRRKKLHRAMETSGSAAAKEQESKELGKILKCVQKTESSFNQQKFRFWCEKCKVGANATRNMFDHLNGKKHKANINHQEKES